jgi:hypothetical protein
MAHNFATRSCEKRWSPRMRRIEPVNFKMQPVAGHRPWNDEAHGKARQRPGVRWPSTAFAAPSTHPERQPRKLSGQNLAGHFDVFMQRCRKQRSCKLPTQWTIYSRHSVHHDCGASFSTAASPVKPRFPAADWTAGNPYIRLFKVGRGKSLSVRRNID